MSQNEPIEFALRGRIGGVEISPQGVPFGLMAKFHDDVEKLILGSNQGSLADSIVQVRTGSYALVIPVPENVRESFEEDMARTENPEGFNALDPARAEVLELWQKQTRADPTLTFAVRPLHVGRFRELVINSETQFKRTFKEAWIAVELVLLGEILEAGGTSRSNIHFKRKDTGKTEIITTKSDQLRNEEYPIYRQKLVRVAAEQNPRSGELRKLRLIEFLPYSPKFDQAAFDRMTDAGEKAWADVEDPAQWVRDLRGGKNG